MNKFIDVVEAMKKRAASQEILDKILPEIDKLDVVPHDDMLEPGLELPYSSDPRPIERSWVTN
ncbi:MAG: hypothetical protein WCA78_08985 [Rhizomicrobium sp.]